MIVYRLEKNGIGPYISRSNAYRLTQKRTRYRRIKKYIPIQAEYDKRRTEEHTNKYIIAHGKAKYMFGCSSKEQLKRYFYGDFKVLFRQGFRIKRYKVLDDKFRYLCGDVVFPVWYHT